MDSCKEAQFVETLVENTPGLNPDDAAALVFLEPIATGQPFTWRDCLVYRAGFCFSHGCVRTSTACQGKALKGGVVIDAAARTQSAHPMDGNTLWLHF